MYDVRQFKPALYILVLLGIAGFSLAAQTPSLWLFATAAVLLNAWLVNTNRFTPLPRLLANGITLVLFLYAFQQVYHARQAVVFLIGQFLVLLHLVKLYEQRSNRDYAQLLVLSLLLMVAASINTASLLFGVLLAIYLFASLYCCLLFHLKAEADLAKAAMAIGPEKMTQSMIRQDQRHLPRSMRRLTGLVSGASIVVAVIVFLFFPRGSGAGLLGPLQWRTADTLTGFSDQVNFQQIARITQDTAEVAKVWVWSDDKPLRGTRTIYLRGMALDRYSGSGNGAPEGRWQWSRSDAGDSGGDQIGRPDPGTPVQLISHDPPIDQPTLKQDVYLQPTGALPLFAMAGLERFTPDRPVPYRWNERDGVLQLNDPQYQTLHYIAYSHDGPDPEDAKEDRRPAVDQNYIDYVHHIDPQIAAYARRADVGGDLVAQRGNDYAPNPLDQELARRIEHHLQTQFTYTLDLRDAARIGNEDPVVAFLTRIKRGHCEYFAGAMTLLCQSLHMNARMVVGFKCDDFNPAMGCYTVQQNHAHAWVEVLTPGGWITFDPTSGRDAGPSKPSLARTLKNWFDYLDFTWASHVVAYGNTNRENLVSKINAGLSETTTTSSQVFNHLGDKLDGLTQWFTSNVIAPIVATIMGLLVLGAVGSIGYFAYERWRLRRRAARIGLGELSNEEQLRLVRQLGFYDDLLRLLERHAIVAQPHLTPLEFAESLTFLPSETFDAVRRLTGIYYRIRYGRGQIGREQQERLQRVLERVASTLGQAIA